MPVLANPKHEQFAQGIALGKTPPEAYVSAGYSKSGAAQSAGRLLRNADVSSRIAELAAKVNEVLEKRFNITVDRIAQELAALAFFNPADLFDEVGNLISPQMLPRHVAAALHQVEVFEEFEGKGEKRELIGFTKKIKWHDKNVSLNTLAKYKGMLIERSEIGRPGEFEHLSEAELDAELEATEAILKASGAASAAGKKEKVK